MTGREGTIRDVTVEKELREEVLKTKERLVKTTADIDKLIHTFLHPVVKFSGNAELLSQQSLLLKKTIQPGIPHSSYGKDLGKKILKQLIEIKNNLPDIDKKLSYDESQRPIHEKEEINLLTSSSLKDALKVIINVFDYSLRTERSGTLLNDTIKDTALWVLQELDRVDYSNQRALQAFIKKDFIELLQGILFDRLVHGSKILKEEAEIMKRGVEALRGYIGLREKRKISIMECDIGFILKKNVERFKPILSEKEIEIYYKPSGNLKAEASPNDIDRVICNLLHNAKKYSHPGPGRFLNIGARELQPDNMVEISIASFGIPIKRDELESESIFEFGIRGELAFKSDRDGTGVGLADAKEIVEAHGGNIHITSVPAKGENETEPPQYKVPYLTNISIRIPKKAGHKEE